MDLVIRLLLIGLLLVKADKDNIIFPDELNKEVVLTEEPETEIQETEFAEVISTSTTDTIPAESPIQRNDVIHYNKQTLPKCPDGLNYYVIQNKIPLCYLITKPSSFPPMCPYPNNIEYYFLKSRFSLELTNNTIWAFGMRSHDDVFRWIKYVIAQNTTDDMIPMEDIIYDNMTTERCLIFDGTNLAPENCSEKHSGICIYSYSSFLSSSYCQMRYNETCVSNLQTKCYCRSETETSNSPRSTFCNKLAEIENPYENYLLAKQVTRKESCWIGLDKDETGIFRWNSSKSLVGYTYWSNTTFDQNYGALGNRGWSLQNDSTLNCAICELPIEVRQKVRLYLTQNGTSIQLEIWNATAVYQGVICFTNNDMKFINLTSNNQNYIIINLWNLNQVTEFCWCRTVQMSVMTYMYSNRIYAASAASENLTQRKTCPPTFTTSMNMELYWPETEHGVTIIPEQLCLQEDGSPVTRTCGENSTWLPVKGACAPVTFAPRTLHLDSLLRSDKVTADNLSASLLHITEDRNNVTTFQMHLMSQVLEKAATTIESVGEKIVKNVVSTINNVMHFEHTMLEKAQEQLNSTDVFLCNLDKLLIHANVGEDGYTSEVSEKLLTQISNIKRTGITGLKLRAAEENGFNSNMVDSLKQDASPEDLMKENLEIAMLTPSELVNEIVNCPGSKDSPNIITTVFYDDVLFNEQGNGTGKTEGRIVSVLIPGFNCSFSAPIQIMFRTSSNQSQELKCASWNYGSNELMKNIRGHWLIENEPKSAGDLYQICEFTHATHFSLLILGGRNISEGHKKALDIITAVGSGLSILGLLVVFLTAILFKSYRQANGVVINFSVAMTAQIVLLFIADNIEEDKVFCTIFGAALHYIVLAQFCWMLTIGFLQYKRYVLIFSNPTTHLVAKTCAFAWGFPLLPVIIIVSISTDNYGPNSYGLCYALGNYFIFGVLVPVSLIVFINLIIFLRIMISIASSRKITVHQRNDDTSILQLRLAFMLYFLLGLTWGFGLLAAVGGGLVYSYLFCLTATLQGFVLFIFFIILNEKTRSLWIDMKTCCRKGQSDKYDFSADSAATAMVRRAKTTASSDTCTDSATSEILRRYKNRSSSDF